MRTAALDVRRLLHGCALRAAIFTIAGRHTTAGWMRAFLRVRHNVSFLLTLPAFSGMFLISGSHCEFILDLVRAHDLLRRAIYRTLLLGGTHLALQGDHSIPRRDRDVVGVRG